MSFIGVAVNCPPTCREQPVGTISPPTSGKMNKPDYFVENQTPGFNRHDKLSPAMSLLVIVGHVKDGLELAREFNLPRRLWHFIESHHGTTLVRSISPPPGQAAGRDALAGPVAAARMARRRRRPDRRWITATQGPGRETKERRSS